jgi:hypothetical protein
MYNPTLYTFIWGILVHLTIGDELRDTKNGDLRVMQLSGDLCLINDRLQDIHLTSLTEETVRSSSQATEFVLYLKNEIL